MFDPKTQGITRAPAYTQGTKRGQAESDAVRKSCPKRPPPSKSKIDEEKNKSTGPSSDP